jgi:hypothetical protein
MLNYPRSGEVIFLARDEAGRRCLPTFSSPSLAGRVAGITRDLLLGFQSGLPLYSFVIFRIVGLLLAFRSATRPSRATLIALRAAWRSMAAGVSASDFARVACSNWIFFASEDALRRSAKSGFDDFFIPPL